MTESRRTLRRNAGRAKSARPESATAGAPGVAPPVSGHLWAIPILLCPQAALFVAFAGDLMDLPAYLASHLGLCAATAAVGARWAAASPAPNRGAPNRGDRIALVLQLVVWTTLAGPF